MGKGGIEKNPAAAIEWTRKAAVAGDAYAMINLAVFYERGMGVEADSKISAEWITRAANSGHWAGLISRGIAYYEGHFGLKVDAKAGEADLRAALAMRNRDVLDRLTFFYATGKVTSQ